MLSTEVLRSRYVPFVYNSRVKKSTKQNHTYTHDFYITSQERNEKFGMKINNLAKLNLRPCHQIIKCTYLRSVR